MLSKNNIKIALEKIENQLQKAKEYLNKNEIDDALYYIWLAAENIINTLKSKINGFYLKDHKEKSDLLKRYYAENILSEDYSKIFEKLAKYRLAAQFEPYTSIPKDYTKEEVIFYFEKVMALKEEVLKHIKK